MFLFRREHRTLLNSVLGVAWFWLLGALLLGHLPTFGRTVLGGDTAIVSWLYAVCAAGLGLGALLYRRLARGQIEIGLVPLGSLGLSLFALDLAFAAPAVPTQGLGLEGFLHTFAGWRISIDLLLISVAGALYSIPLYQLLRARSAPAHRPTVMALCHGFSLVFLLIGAAFSGLLLDRLEFTAPQLFFAAAVLNAVVAIYIYTVVPEFMLRFISYLLVRSFYRVKVTGMEHVPESGPVLIAANHVSFVDPLLILGTVRRPIRFVMYQGIYAIPLLKNVFDHVKAIPIGSRKTHPEVLERALERVDEELAAGEPVGIFPEGGITRDGEIQPFRPGIETMLAQQPVPVVPLALCNLWGSLFSRRDPLHKRRPRKFRKTIELRFGPPLAPEAASAARIEQEVRALRGADR
ncbi:MAG: 1-acyl-sn-glycerol-3-phosphate acyltransferase [Pseudomonadota bacterium]